MKRILICATLLALGAVAAAQDTAPTVPPTAPPPDASQDQVVEVPGTKNPELKPYRIMHAGLVEFAERRAALAPGAPELRFKLYPRYGALPPDDVALRIAGGDVSVSVPIAADATFALPDLPAALDSDADLLLNKRKGQFSWHAEVRTAGLPPNTLRLGDLRLECEVEVAIAKKEINFAIKLAVNVALGSNWCQYRKGSYFFDAPARYDSLTFIAGERRVEQQQGHRQRMFKTPIADPSWPDDTLIEFQISAPGDATLYAVQPIYLRSSADHWGTEHVLRQLDAANPSIYAADVALAPGRHEFKVGSADFNEIDLGAGSGSNDVTPGQPRKLVERGSNLALRVEQAATYHFALAVRDPDQPQLTVTQ